MEKIIFLKYGELNTKKGNINIFINRLYHNILKKLNGEEVTVTKSIAHIYIEINEENETRVVSKLKEVFGIYSIVISYKVPSDLDAIKNNALNLLENKSFNTFKVETKRSDKSFPHTSMEVSRLVGAHLLKNIENKKVDVINPELLLGIEIRNDYTYLYFDEIKGLGGYPVGIQGKGVLMLSGGIDSPVAGFLSLKRGVELDCLYFESPPHTSIEAQNKVINLTKKLTKYTDSIKLHIVPFTKLQESIYKNVDPSYMITIMRRMMYRIAEAFTNKIHAHVIINGESIGQVASQTLTSMRIINSVTNLPVIRPLACFDKLEIIDIAKRIDTYDISILPFQDCCTIFLPEHPVINPDLEKCLQFEKNFDYQNLVNDCLNNINTININEFDKSSNSDLL